MTAAVYDNPDTFCREYWQDGRLMAFVSANLLLKKVHEGRLPALDGFAWRDGRLTGDFLAVAPLNSTLGHP
ncbi:hypothetical protein [Solimonas marina]|uniref:Uncharacterized protein n=1 Tax=Solimonas marina TaxID=2714601 RepID=A0A970B8P4_9GAMM|nr:hypothetical protein [Solimonas marina]NKF21591.1 hypothetical protein [Solimonas marina]